MDHVRLTPETLKALAHPLRVRLLNLLRERGPATATRLAELTGQSSGATSYHLRQLAAHGFVEEDDEQVASGRERWWKAAHARTRLEATEARQSPSDTEAYLRSVALLYAERTERWLAEAPLLTPEWDTGATLSDARLRLTPAEAAQLIADIDRLMESYRGDGPDVPAPPDAERVVFQVQVMPFMRGSE